MKKSVLFLSVVLLMLSCAQENKNNSQGNTNDPNAQAIAAKFSVAAPFEGKLNVAPQVFTIDPAKGATLTLANGGMIKVPEQSFVYANGSFVTEKVEIRYREFHTPGEIIASGIPMKAVGPDGQVGYMESAGMFEITGFARNEAVQIAPHKEITVDMKSHAPGKFDAWFFDPAAGNWVDIGDSDVTQPVAGMNNSIGENDNSENQDALLAGMPKKPVLLDQSKPKLNFDVNFDRFPELKAMKGMVLQYNGNDPKLDPTNNDWIFSHKWDDIKLSPVKADGSYYLTLDSDDETFSLPVTPCLSGQEYTVALRNYEKKLADFKRSASAPSQRALLRLETQEYLRTMGISQFGIHNYDIFWKNQENVKILADFDFQGIEINEELKDAISVYLICKGGRMVIGFDKGGWSKFSFDPNTGDNQLLAVLPDQKIAIIDQKAFQAMVPVLKTKEGLNHTFIMQAQPTNILTVADIDKALAYRG